MKASDLILPFGGGLLLSSVYFAALWVTVKFLPFSRQPLLTLGASFVLRMLGLLGGFWYLMDGHWEKLLACVTGFFIVRTICVMRMKAALPRVTSAQES